MKKKLTIIFLALVLSLSCIAVLSACNSNSGDNLVLNKGSRPDYASLIGQDDLAVINSAISESATEEQKKNAVMALYSVANYSRQNTELSLMLQSSDAGVDVYFGNVIMHGFNLKSGDKWYYQLVTQASSSNSAFDLILGLSAGLLKVAYTAGDGDYYYTVYDGTEYECDCTVKTFPYAEFIVTKSKSPTVYDLEQFNKELHCLSGIHEINNMKFCADIIADGAKITYDAQEKFYTVEFSVDMSSDEELLKEWFALPKEDMAVGGQKLNGYNEYKAVLEVWDNGYAKSFSSWADRDAGLFASGKPTDKFEYIWKENEILNLLNEDASIEETQHGRLDTADDFIEFYSNPPLKKAGLSKLAVTGIAAGGIVGGIILIIAVSVIAVETLLKKGKLPKLAAKRAAKKQKRIEKKAKRAEKKEEKKS